MLRCDQGLGLPGWLGVVPPIRQESLLLERWFVPDLFTTVSVDIRRYLQNITIPAAFVQRSVGDSLKQLIKPQKDLPHPKVLVSLDWTDLLPRNEVVSDRCASHAASACLKHTEGYRMQGPLSSMAAHIPALVAEAVRPARLVV